MIRAVAPGDLALVYDSWLKSYASSDFARIVTPPAVWDANKGHGGAQYNDVQKATIVHLVATSVLLVDEDVDGEHPVVDAWICGWPRTTLHYVYVKQGVRGRGHARRLLDAMQLREGERVRYSHRARGIRGNPRGWTFDPSVMFGKAETMARQRVKYLKLHTVTVPFTTRHGNKEQVQYLREEDQFVAEFDEQTRLIMLHAKDRAPGGRVVSATRCIPIEQVQYFELYAKGERPQWEVDAESAAKGMPAP